MKTASYRPLLFFGHESRNAGGARPFACLHEGQETAMNIENRQGRATEYKYDLRAN